MRLFHRITLLTPESVELELILAGIGNRALALFLDYLVIWLTLGVFWLFWTSLATVVMAYLDQMGGDYGAAPLWLLAIGLLISFALSTGYFAGFEVLWQGQTPAKRLIHIRVIQDNGRPVGVAQALLRALLQPFDLFFLIGAFLIFFGKREKRLGDLLAGTLVIQEGRPTSSKLHLSEGSQAYAPQLLQQVDLAQLSPDDFAIIREYLQRRSAMASQAQQRVSLELAHQAQAVLHLEALPSEVTPDQFLESLYLAYQEKYTAYLDGESGGL